jgi:hypothetical protein
MKEIHNCSNKGPGPLQRENITKVWRGHLKVFSRTTTPEKFRFTCKLPVVVQN